MKRILIILFLLIAVPAWGGQWIQWIQSYSNIKTYLTLPNADRTAIKELNDNTREIENGGLSLGATARLSTSDTYKFVTASTTDLRPYALGGYKIRLHDGTKYMTAVLGDCGTGETLDATNRMATWTNSATYPFETFESDGANITSAINTTSLGIAYNQVNNGLGDLVKYTTTMTVNSGTINYGYIGSTTQQSGTYYIWEQLIVSGDKTAYINIMAANQDYVSFIEDAAVNFSSSNNVLNLVTAPDTTGAMLTNISAETGFNYNSGGYVIDIYKDSLSSITGSGVLLGDSTTAAYLTFSAVDVFLENAGGLAGIANLAVPGHTIAQQKTAWTNDANKATYDWIIVRVGLNDLGSASSAVITALQDLVDTINSGKKSGAVVIICALTSSRASIGETKYVKWLAVNEAIMGGGSTPITGVNYRIDAYNDVIGDANDNLKTLYDYGDHIHMNNPGRIIIAGEYKAILKKAGF